MIRVIYGISVVLLAVYMPWYIFAIVLFLGCILYRPYPESIAIAFFYDFLYGIGEYNFTLAFIAILMISLAAKRYIG